MAQAIGIFNILVGLMFASSFVIFAGGFVAYLCRLGNINREDGLDIMEIGLTTIFVLVIILGIIRIIQHVFFAS